LAAPERVRERERMGGGGAQQHVDTAWRDVVERQRLMAELDQRLLGEPPQVRLGLGDQHARHRRVVPAGAILGV
jgi:hypothetical protein